MLQSDHSTASKNKQKHSDISSISDSDKLCDDERADNSDTSESESDSENDILTPEEGFRVPQGTLSNFNLQSDEDSFTRLQNSFLVLPLCEVWFEFFVFCSLVDFRSYINFC